MNRLVILSCCFLWSVVAFGASYYRENVTFLPATERESALMQLSAIETPTEAQYLTQVALEKPDIFLRQLNRALDVIRAGGEGDAVPKGLRDSGFLGADTQERILIFAATVDEADRLTPDDVFRFVLLLNDRSALWEHVMAGDSRDDFNALECAPSSAPSELLGPEMHQYVMQVGYPDMELTLWRFDAAEAITYPVAVVIETTVNQYRLNDRFGLEFGVLDRRDLTLQLPGETVHCAKVSASVLRAYQEHRREVILSDKQL
jgi:hypothetical protein